MGFESFNNEPIAETSNSMSSEQAKVLEKEEHLLDELLQQENQLQLELQNAKEARDMIHINNESTENLSEKDKSEIWDRQRKIKDTEIQTIAKKIDELNNKIVDQQHKVAEAKDALTRAQEG